MLDKFTSFATSWFTVFAESVPLEVYSFVGSFLEELIAPIPSPIVMSLAGTVAFMREQPVGYLFWLALFAATGKTLGSYILYRIGDTLEDVLTSRVGKYVGVTHKQVEGFGKYLDRGWRDNVVLYLLRVIPIFSSGVISLLCGVIKIDRKTFLTTTLLGVYTRDLMYLYIGYYAAGNAEAAARFIERFEDYAKTFGLGVATVIIGFGIWYLMNRKKKKTLGKEQTSKVDN